MYTERNLRVHKGAIVRFLADKGMIKRADGNPQIKPFSPRLLTENPEIREALIDLYIGTPASLGERIDGYLAVESEERPFARLLCQRTKLPLFIMHPDETGMAFSGGRSELSTMNLAHIRFTTQDGQREADIARHVQVKMSYTARVSHIITLLDFNEGAGNHLLSQVNARLLPIMTMREIERLYNNLFPEEHAPAHKHPPKRQAGFFRRQMFRR